MVASHIEYDLQILILAQISKERAPLQDAAALMVLHAKQ